MKEVVNLVILIHTSINLLLITSFTCQKIVAKKYRYYDCRNWKVLAVYTTHSNSEQSKPGMHNIWQVFDIDRVLWSSKVGQLKAWIKDKQSWPKRVDRLHLYLHPRLSRPRHILGKVRRLTLQTRRRLVGFFCAWQRECRSHQICSHCNQNTLLFTQTGGVRPS